MDLATFAARTPHKPAVVFGGRAVTYAELERRSLRLAHLLQRRGIGRGDHVAILMDNRPEWFDVAWACQRSGVLYTPVNWHLTEDEAAFVVDDCGARALFTSDALAGLAEQVVRRTPGLELTVMAGPASPGFLALEEVCTAEPDEPVEECEGSYFFYSSGTTGMPKGIAPEHDFPPYGTGLALDRALPAFGFSDATTYLCPAPLYHAAPLGWTLGTHRHGGTVVLMDRFDPAACLRLVEEHRVTHVQFVPTHLVRLLKLDEQARTAHDLSSLQLVVHAAAPCPVEVKPMGVDVHVTDEEGRELPPGEVGTVWFAGGAAFRYHRDEAKTAAAFNARGWSTLGDLGHLDEEGYLYLADRRTDLVITGGVNVYPAEVEQALIMHPQVADVAVIGVSDDEMGQAVKAVVQPAPGAAPTEQELVAWSRDHLAGFKVPRSIAFVEEPPRLPSGKLLRRRVREEHGTP